MVVVEVETGEDVEDMKTIVLALGFMVKINISHVGGALDGIR